MQRLLTLGVLILLLGFFILAVSVPMGSNGSFGGVIFIGPLPIVFGSGPGEPVLLILSVLIGVVMAGMVFLWRKRP